MSTSDTTASFSTVAITPVWGEGQLVAELRQGSVEAFDYLIALYHQPLYRFIGRLLADPEDAADVLQETFLKVFRAASRFEGKCSLKTWVYQIALHEAGNQRRWWRRHKSREMSIEEEHASGGSWADCLPDQSASPLMLAVRSEQQQHLRGALAALPEPFQAALTLRELEGFSYDEIAAITGARLGTVKSRILRGREMLRELMLNPGAVADPGGARHV